jgi:hypothetical protein
MQDDAEMRIVRRAYRIPTTSNCTYTIDPLTGSVSFVFAVLILDRTSFPTRIGLGNESTPFVDSRPVRAYTFDNQAWFELFSITSAHSSNEWLVQRDTKNLFFSSIYPDVAPTVLTHLLNVYSLVDRCNYTVDKQDQHNIFPNAIPNCRLPVVTNWPLALPTFSPWWGSVVFDTRMMFTFAERLFLEVHPTGAVVNLGLAQPPRKRKQTQPASKIFLSPPPRPNPYMDKVRTVEETWLLGISLNVNDMAL